MNWRLGVGLAVGILAVLVGMMALGGALALRQQPAQDFLLASAGFDPNRLPPESVARADAIREAVGMAVDRRVGRPWVALLLVGVLGLSFSRLLRAGDGVERVSASSVFETPFVVSDFVLLLVITGALLALGPEFVYVRDTFGQRINTLFKFYYAAWIVLGIAAAYATWHLSTTSALPRALRGLFSALATMLVSAGLVYTVLAIPAKANFQAEATLDGIAYIGERSPADLEGIRWLQANADSDAVVLEAIGGQYSFYGRVSSTTGLPTLLGWPGHELQWRGSLEQAGNREADVRMIYSTPDMRVAEDLLEQYGVTYVFVGSLERSYGTPAGLEKFEQFLTAAYQNDSVTIYRADQPLTLETQ